MAAVGAQTGEAVASKIAGLQDELRDTKRRMKAGGAAGGGAARAADLVGSAADLGSGVRAVIASGSWESLDAMKAVAKDLRGLLPSGVIALALEADEPQVFVSVSDDLVARGFGAGDLVREAMPAIDGRGGGKAEMAQGRGTNVAGVPAAVAAIETSVRARAGRSE